VRNHGLRAGSLTEITAAATAVQGPKDCEQYSHGRQPTKESEHEAQYQRKCWAENVRLPGGTPGEYLTMKETIDRRRQECADAEREKVAKQAARDDRPASQARRGEDKALKVAKRRRKRLREQRRRPERTPRRRAGSVGGTKRQPPRLSKTLQVADRKRRR